MRVEWNDHVGQQHSITSKDPVTLGRWFYEMGCYLMSADSRMQGTRITIWPMDKADMELIGATHKQFAFTQAALLEFAQSILNLSDRKGAQERELERGKGVVSGDNYPG
jgi:hypothetical protein